MKAYMPRTPEGGLPSTGTPRQAVRPPMHTANRSVALKPPERPTAPPTRTKPRAKALNCGAMEVSSSQRV